MHNLDTTPVEQAAFAKTLGLSQHEYAHIVDSLQRLPTHTEIAVLAGMWSEHCSYKSTKHLLKKLPQTGEHILAGPGAHAGVVDVGDGWAVAFKIESHNHPSAVDPYQGAATGVGGILRDIIAQGARPCAVMDSLCLGEPAQANNKRLEEGIVAGIAGYGNAIGVANVGGQTVYDACYTGNPLVNALAAGLVRHDALRGAKVHGHDHAVLCVGAATGRDGILGAAFASEALGQETKANLSHVQVGDPFAGKKLLEACLNFTESMGLLGCQDLGACGLACASMEIASLSCLGMELSLDHIITREPNMTPQEILLSESQERFMLVVRAETVDTAIEHFHAHGVHAVLCGRMVPGTHVVVRYHGEVYVDLPADLVAGGAPAQHWPVAATSKTPVPYPIFAEPNIQEALLRLLQEPGIASLEPLYQHYDQTIGNQTVRGPGSAAAAVLKLPDSQRGFALCITGRGELCAADAFLGAQAALAEAQRRLACVGAKLCAITDGLNMASPRKPHNMRQIEDILCGLQAGCEALAVPVTGGNVSLYNESVHGQIKPTPMIGGLGVVENVRCVPQNKLIPGHMLWLVGEPTLWHEQLPSSRYGRLYSGVDVASCPAVDLPAEQRLASWLIDVIGSQYVTLARPIGLGGMLVALSKLCIKSGYGVDVCLPTMPWRQDWLLFGEFAAMVWLACPPKHANTLQQTAVLANIPLRHVGTVRHDQVFDIEHVLSCPLFVLAKAYEA